MIADGAVPRTAFTYEEAAESIGVSLSTFRRHVLPSLKVVKLGTVRLVPQSELLAWLDRASTLCVSDTAYATVEGFNG